MKVTLIAEDLSAIGQISMGAAIGIFNAFDISTATLPTTVLSTQTEGFGLPTELHTHQWIPQALLHWQATNEVIIDVALVGYVGSIQVVQQIVSILKRHQPRIVVVDPVMGDNNQLYPGFDYAYVEDIRILAQYATILTPNWTELQLLAGVNLEGESFSTERLDSLLDQLKIQGICAQVVVTGIERGRQTGCVYRHENGELTWYLQPTIPGHFYGAGDAFSAILTGYLQSGLTFEEALKLSTQGVHLAIKATAKLPTDERKYGLRLRPLIRQIINGDTSQSEDRYLEE